MSKVWLQITSGRCPAECQWVVAQLTDYIVKSCHKKKITNEIIEIVKGDENGTYKSAFLRIENEDFHPLLKHGGTVLWHGQSPFRVRHKRKNWYIGVEVLSPNVETGINSDIEKEIKVDTFKSSGKGGQNVNKRDTAVRITHLPTKLSVVGREERTQGMNRKLALARLQTKLATINQTHLDNNDKARWQQHENLQRGNPIMRFKGADFKQY